MRVVNEKIGEAITMAVIRDIAAITSYLVEGCNVSLEAIENQNFDNPSNGGHTGMVSDMTTLAMAINARIQAEAEHAFLGVIEYEVIEPLGRWICAPARGPYKVTFHNYIAGFAAWIGHFEMMFQLFLAKELT